MKILFMLLAIACAQASILAAQDSIQTNLKGFGGLLWNQSVDDLEVHLEKRQVKNDLEKISNSPRYAGADLYYLDMPFMGIDGWVEYIFWDGKLCGGGFSLGQGSFFPNTAFTIMINNLVSKYGKPEYWADNKKEEMPTPADILFRGRPMNSLFPIPGESVAFQTIKWTLSGGMIYVFVTNDASASSVSYLTTDLSERIKKNADEASEY